MKRLSKLFILLPIIILLGFQNVFALGVVSPATNVQNSIFMGQKHDYHVIFRANGEAIVYANIEFSNATDNNMSQFEFESPVEIRDLTMYQYYQEYCANCEYPTYKNIEMYTDPSSSYMPYQRYYGNLYTKLKFNSANNKYTVKLSKDVLPNEQGKILLGYSTRNFTSELLGGFDYNFKSLKVNSRVELMHVNISVDGDLLLKGATSAVDQIENSSGASMDYSVSSEKAVPSQNLDGVLNTINMGTIYKSFTQVATDEVVTVSGEYSSMGIRLYAKEIAITILVFALIIAAGIVIKKRLPKSTAVQSKTKGELGKSDIVLDIGMGLISAFVVTLFTIFITYVGNSVGYMWSYGSLSGLVYLALVVVSVLVYLLITLAAPIIRGIKKGWVSFVTVLSSEIIFLVILVLLFVLIFSTSSMTTYPYPIY